MSDHTSIETDLDRAVRRAAAKALRLARTAQTTAAALSSPLIDGHLKERSA